MKSVLMFASLGFVAITLISCGEQESTEDKLAQGHQVRGIALTEAEYSNPWLRYCVNGGIKVINFCQKCVKGSKPVLNVADDLADDVVNTADDFCAAVGTNTIKFDEATGCILERIKHTEPGNVTKWIPIKCP